MVMRTYRFFVWDVHSLMEHILDEDLYEFSINVESVWKLSYLFMTQMNVEKMRAFDIFLNAKGTYRYLTSKFFFVCRRSGTKKFSIVRLLKWKFCVLCERNVLWQIFNITCTHWQNQKKKTTNEKKLFNNQPPSRCNPQSTNHL